MWGNMKVRSFVAPMALLVSVLTISIALPIQSAGASSIDDQAMASSQAQQGSEPIARAQDEPPYDGSTNCETGATPFISGVIKDSAGNALAGARVVAKIFSQTSVNYMTSQFIAWETKADGSYSLCSWDQSWATTFAGLQSQTAALIMTVQPPTSMVSRTSATTLASISTSFPASVNSNLDNRCLKPASLATPCVINLQLRGPVVQATVVKQGGTALPLSNVAIEYKLANIKWTTLADISANAEGWFGLSGFNAANNFRVRVTPPYCQFEDVSLCTDTNLGSSADNFSVAVTTPGDPSTASGTWASTTTNSKVFTILPANFNGSLKDLSGALLTDQVQIVATQATTQKTQEVWTMGGNFLLTLDDGDWVVDVKNPGGALIKDTSFNVTAASGAVTAISKADGSVLCSAATTPCVGPFSFSVEPPNFMALVKDDLGAIVQGAEMYVSRYDSTTPQQPWKSDGLWSRSGVPTDQWNPRAAGLLGVPLAVDTVYQLQLSPPYEGDYEVTGINYLVKTYADGDNLKIQRCASWNNNPETTPCASGYANASLTNAANTMTTTDGKFTLVMPTANFKGVLCSPDTGCSTVGNAYVQIYRQQASQCQNCGASYQWMPGAQVRSDGTFSITIAQAGKYRLDVDPPYSRDGNASAIPYAKTRLEFEAVSDGNGGYQYFTLDSSGTRTTTQLATTPVANKGNRVVMKYLTPSFVGLIRAPDGTIAGNTWVEIQKEIPTQNCSMCREYSSAQVNTNGIFALSLTVGRYFLYANPSWNLEALNLTKTEYRISALDCDSNGVVELYTYESTQCSGATLLTLTDGKAVITLKGANFSGTVRRPDTNAVIPYVSLGVEQWTVDSYRPDGGYWQWANKATSAKSNGIFGINFDAAGRYRVNFNVPYDLMSRFSTSQMIIDVTGSGSFIVTPVADSSIWQSDGNGGYTVKLRLPNVSGTVTLPNGVALASGTTSNVHAEKWNSTTCGDGCYQWTSEVNGVSTNSLGDYAMSVPAGRWKLTFNPPYGVNGYARVSREIVVTSTDVCLLANAVNGACPGAKILPGELDVSLATPNFSGVVKNPDSSLSMWTSVQLMKYNSVTGYWDWTNNGMSTDSLGRFGVNLTENQTYKVIFDPAYTTSGVSSATKYIRVCDGGNSVSALTNEAAAKSGSTCATTGGLRNQEIPLVGSNVRGIITDSSGTALQDVWISTQNCGTGSSPDVCTWDRGVNTKSGSNLGKFDLRLDNDSSRQVTKFIVEVNPPYNSSSGLVRIIKSIWVKDFNSDGNNDWCLDSDYTAGVGGGTCSSIKTSSNTWTLVMTAGNLAGKVLAPSGSTGIPQAQIQVEKWALPEWDLVNGSYGWQWQNMWANANQSGVFGLDITTPGLYRISVSPGWENTAGYARRRYFVRVDSNKDWCVKTGATTSSTAYPSNTATPDDDSCTFGRDNDANDGVTGFGMRVSNSNLRGVLYTSSTNLGSSTDLADASKKIRDGWIGIYKKHAGDWWEWQYGVNSSGAAASKGAFAANIEVDGNYRFEFNPSWMSTGEDAGFKVDFTAANCSTSCIFTGFAGANILKSGDIYNAKYLAPNFSGTILDKTGTTKIAGAWLNVMNTSTGQWVGGISTGWNGTNLGKFALRLADGTYRVEVNPRWDDANSGIRRTLQIEVADGSVTTCSTSACVAAGSNWNISLMGETVSGKVYYPGAADTASDSYATATSGNQTVMPWAWADVRSCTDDAASNCNTYVESQNSNQSGVIKFGLADSATPYLIRFYPNWSVYAGSALEILVKVTAGESTWKYKAENTGYSTGAFTPDFGRIPPNVAVTVSGATSSRYVDLYKCVGTETAGECDSEWQKIATVLSSSDGSNWKANFLVSEALKYKVVAIRQTGDATTNSHVFAYDGTTPVTHTLNLGP